MLVNTKIILWALIIINIILAVMLVLYFYWENTKNHQWIQYSELSSVKNKSVQIAQIFWPMQFHSVHRSVIKLDNKFYLQSLLDNAELLEIDYLPIRAIKPECLNKELLMHYTVEPRWFLGKDNIVSFISEAVLLQQTLIGRSFYARLPIHPPIQCFSEIHDLPTRWGFR